MQKLWLCLVGCGIGWLAGLSVSPVVSVVLSTLLGIAAGLLAVMKGADPANRSSIDAGPAAWLVVGIALAATMGIVARTHKWLSPSELQTEASVPQRTAEDPGEAIEARRFAGVLFVEGTTVCNELETSARLGTDHFLPKFKQMVRRGTELAEQVEPQRLQEMVRILCRW